MSVQCRGVAKQASKSMCVLAEVLYYLSPDGVMAWDGSLPVKISGGLDNTWLMNVRGAVGGVTEAICKEMEKFGTDHVYITLPTMTSEQAKQRFPNIFEACAEEGYDITKDRVPVTPGQHYMMGGIKTDINGSTSMKHLYAVGETACNGVHGKNRLASNSLLESLVFSKRAADLIAADKSEKEFYAPDTDWDTLPPKNAREKEFKNLIMNEIKRKDRAFYDKWCNDED